MNVNVLVILIFYYNCCEFTGIVIGLEPVSQKIPYLILSLTKKMNSLTHTEHLLGFS